MEILNNNSNLQAMSIRMADAVMLDGEVFQQPRMPAVKETNMKKNPTMNRAIMARIMSKEKHYSIFLERLNKDVHLRTLVICSWLKSLVTSFWSGM